MRKLALSLLALATFALHAQNVNTSKFRQLGQELPTPNVYRTASGAPGHEYYQQRADYDMSITLDDETQRIYGEETITYTNNSPDELRYLWVQLDQNMRAQNSTTQQIKTGGIFNQRGATPQTAFNQLKNNQFYDFDGGFKLAYVKATSGANLPYTVNNTMMRVDLPSPLREGQKFSFKIKWWFNINDRMDIGGRSGYEYFEEEDNYLYTIAQFFPRMAVYNDVEGWQNKQFLGQGEFTLPFGDYKVDITVPSDHIVASTGELTNASRILSSKQRARLAKAKKSYDDPVIIVTQEEAEAAEKNKATSTKTWTFEAENVRDFAFATSRKFIWDAQAVDISGKTTMAMSYYPKEGNPLWEQYSTRVVAHTLKVYSKFTIDYPYHKAISVHTKWIGMEYPMICFNGGRPESDGTYSEGTKYGMIGVIIHEVGHNFFPMIINSDERQWTWMDEGLNTFVQYVAEQDFGEWYPDAIAPNKAYPSRRGPAKKIVSYMGGDQDFIAPIMTKGLNTYNFGANAYSKPATGLNILRETIMGRELFDHAFRTYSQRWMFKHPTPEDFFRTMEDASAVDLDWFWRAWFYSTDYTDIGVKDVKKYYVSSKMNKQVREMIEARGMKESDLPPLVYLVEEGAEDFEEAMKTQTLNDVTTLQSYIMDNISPEDRAKLKSPSFFYDVTFEKPGGIPMPIIVEYTYSDGSTKRETFPAQIWRKNDKEVRKVIASEMEITKIMVDPDEETADIDTDNNAWPKRKKLGEFKSFKDKVKN